MFGSFLVNVGDIPLGPMKGDLVNIAAAPLGMNSGNYRVQEVFMDPCTGWANLDIRFLP